ncbi:MAG: YIP1 family protein [Candidatus Woesearchaeota archaeon]|jgi:hypothetical protein|nr:YIP1 family protein [Candidatus Woesearchaeota archaeon]
MGYFTDCLDLFALKDDTYRKVGNDPQAFKKFFLAYLIVMYGMMAFIGIFAAIGVSFFMPEGIPFPQWAVLGILVVFLICPFICFIFTYIITLIPHVIGLALGGNPRSYNDFFKVIQYNYPFAFPLTVLFQNIFGPVYAVWYFFMLYKTYRIIHKLEPQQAGWAIGINLIICLAFVGLIVLVVFYVLTSYPWMMQGMNF